MGPRVLAWSLGLGIAYGLVAGSADHIQFAFGLRAFGGVEYVPRVIVLSAIRGWGPWGSMLVPAITAAVLLHRGRRQGDGPLDPRTPFFAALAVSMLYPIIVTTGCSAALLVWMAVYDGTATAFISAARATVLCADLAFGACASLLEAIVIAIAVRFASTALRSARWHLFWKLVVVFVVLRGISYGIGYGGRWLG